MGGAHMVAAGALTNVMDDGCFIRNRAMAGAIMQANRNRDENAARAAPRDVTTDSGGQHMNHE